MGEIWSRRQGNVKEMENITGTYIMHCDGPFSITERKGNVNYKKYPKTGRSC